MNIDYYTYSDKGPRLFNEDALGVEIIDASSLQLNACIADGVGGTACGEVASNLSVSLFLEILKERPDQDLKKLIIQLHEQVLNLSSQNEHCIGMSTTFSGCVVIDEVLKGIHVGDTRICILRGNGIKQLTEDHTEVSRLLRTNKITLDQFRNYPRKNILESALGFGLEPTIQYFEFDVLKGDRIILTTDGVHGFISKKELRDISIESKKSKEFTQKVISFLEKKLLKDNYSIITITLS